MVRRRPNFFLGSSYATSLENFLILNLKLSNSSHSERHFCSLATYCTSKKPAFDRQRGGACPRTNMDPSLALVIAFMRFGAKSELTTEHKGPEIWVNSPNWAYNYWSEIENNHLYTHTAKSRAKCSNWIYYCNRVMFCRNNSDNNSRKTTQLKCKRKTE